MKAIPYTFVGVLAVFVMAVILPLAAATRGGQTVAGRAAPLATLDFRVLGADGQPVLDLKPADVALKFNGRARELRSLTLVQPTALPPPFASNADADAGRDLLLVVDDESIAPGKEQSLKDAVASLLDSLSSRDRVGFVTVPRARGNVPRTRQHAAVRTAVSKMAGQAQMTEDATELTCRTGLTIESLKGILSQASDPATVVFFSAALAPPNSEAKKMGSSSGTCEVKPDTYRDLGTVAATSSATLYVVNVLDGTSSQSSNATFAAGLESLAGVTGGQLIRLTGGSPAALQRVAKETSSFYRATFETEAAERDGAAHRLELRAGRDGVKVRAQSQMTIPKIDARVSGAPSARDMLRVSTAFRDVPIRAAAFASRQSGDEVKVVVLFEPVDPSVPLKSAAIGLFDEKGKLARQWTAETTDLARTPTMAALTAPAGAYRLRVAATDASGRGGTTDDEIRAEIVRADPIKLSTMLLGTARNGAFSPRLQFAGEPAAVGYLEVYGVQKNAAVVVTLELKATDEGAPLATAQTQVQPGASDDLRMVFGGFAIDALKPGDYIVRANVSVDGKVVGQASRTLRKAAP